MTTSPPKETPLRAAIGSRSLARESADRPANNVLSRLLKNSSSKGTFEGSPKGEM